MTCLEKQFKPTQSTKANQDQSWSTRCAKGGQSPKLPYTGRFSGNRAAPIHRPKDRHRPKALRRQWATTGGPTGHGCRPSWVGPSQESAPKAPRARFFEPWGRQGQLSPSRNAETEPPDSGPAIGPRAADGWPRRIAPPEHKQSERNRIGEESRTTPRLPKSARSSMPRKWRITSRFICRPFTA